MDDVDKIELEILKRIEQAKGVSDIIQAIKDINLIKFSSLNGGATCHSFPLNYVDIPTYVKELNDALEPVKTKLKLVLRERLHAELGFFKDMD